MTPRVLLLLALALAVPGCKRKPLPQGSAGAGGAAQGLKKSTVASAGQKKVSGLASDLRPSPDNSAAAVLVNGQLPSGPGVPPPMRLGELWVVRAEGEPKQLGAGVPNVPGGWLFSDDSRYLMFLTSYALSTQAGTLWVVDLRAPAAERQKIGEEVGYYVASPDSSTIAFVEKGVLKVGPLPAGPFRELAGEVATTEFSPDSKTLYFRRRVVAAGGLFQVALADEKKAPRKLTDQVGDFEVSKDGSRVAYLARQAPSSRTFQLFVADAATLKSTKVAEPVLRFRFSGDGKHLARIQTDDPQQPGELWLGSGDGSVGTKVGDRVKDFTFSADGSKLAFRQKYQEVQLVGDNVEKLGELVLLALPGGTSKVLEKKCANYLISPDSKVLAYTATVRDPKFVFSRDLFVLRDGDAAPTRAQAWLYDYSFTPKSDRLLFRADCIRDGRACGLLALDLTKPGVVTEKLADSVFSFRLNAEGTKALITYAHTTDESFDVFSVDVATKAKKDLDGNVKVPVHFLGNRVVYIVEERARAGVYVADL